MALLLWIIGNEPDLHYSNPKVFDAINDISKMIHELDGRHPTTTALSFSFKPELVDHVKQRMPDLDIISVQKYADIVNLPVKVNDDAVVRFRDIASLREIAFDYAILDEAQAIKNTATQRSRAAMALQGDFKMVTTGTPIENHLGELWNLFRFINPGLLGNLDHFNQRFATPIEARDDRQARQQLKQLIRPFILRRTKQEVAREHQEGEKTQFV